MNKPTGVCIDPTLARQFTLEINCYFDSEEIIFEFFYEKNHVSECWLNQLKNRIKSSYQKLALDLNFSPLREKRFGLAPLQKGLLYHAATQSTQNEYITQVIWDINSELDMNRFQNAWCEVVSKVEILRTYYTMDEKKPLQCVLPDYQSACRVIDLSDVVASEQSDQINLIIHEQRNLGFNLFKEPPTRAILIACSNQKFIFVWTHHHIMMDGWSLNNLKRLLEKCYENKKSLPLISYQPYIDFLEAKNKNQSIFYWKNKFENYEPVFMPILNFDKD